MADVRYGEYQHFFSAVPNKGDYPAKYNFVLLNELSALREVLNSHAAEPALCLDTETNSLNHQTGRMVGYSFSYDGITGYYVPTAHKVGTNCPLHEALMMIFHHIQGKTAYFWNKRFDLRFFSAESRRVFGQPLDITTFKHFDVQPLVWLSDTNIKSPTLKWAEKHFLGWDALTFEDLIDGGSIELMDPVDVVQYAVTDCLGPIHLLRRMATLIPDCRFAARMDNGSIDVIKSIEETPMLCDANYLEALEPSIDARIKQVESRIFEIVGRTFKVGSSDQVRQALIENGCAPSQKTPKGKVSTSSKYLQHIKHPLAQLVMEFRSLNTLKNSYVHKLAEESRKKGGYVNVNHLCCHVPTGRYATGSDRKNDFFSSVNIQSIIKPDEGYFRPTRLNSFQDGIAGWSFEHIKDPEFKGEKVEGLDPHNNVRMAFKPPEGFLWVSIDYVAQELRLPTNFSREPVFLNAFLTGKDVHNEVAARFLGEPVTKPKRRIAKACNFGLMFLGNHWTIMNAVGCSEQEAASYVSNYERAHKTLYQWKAAVIRKAKRTGSVSTYYGRPRRLRHWMTHKDYKKVMFGKRSAVNSVVQGTAADVLKVALIRIYNEIYLKQKIDLEAVCQGDYDSVDFLFHPIVHDEINYLVRISKAQEIILQLIELMTVQEKDWPVPMIVDVSLGDSWGNIFPFVCNEEDFYPKLAA